MFTIWIPIEKIQRLINLEGLTIISLLLLAAYFFYRFFLKKVSEKRHRQLMERFKATSLILLSSILTSVFHWVIFTQFTNEVLLKISNYIGLISLILGAVALIKIGQTFVYLYLFLSNITTGVPRLIGNLFTSIFSIIVFGLIASKVFGLNMATIATTSAVFSLVLGLALQDTLGNFFSGLALQIDRPFHINDWVEIQNGDQKWVGQIHEINWRATFVMSFSDELMMFPNRFIAQSQIIILTNSQKPVRLNQVFRFPFDTPLDPAKEALLSSVTSFPQVMKDPGPLVLVTEMTDSWVTMKVFYSLWDYGLRYRTGDAIIYKALQTLREQNIKVAHQTFSITSPGPGPASHSS